MTGLHVEVGMTGLDVEVEDDEGRGWTLKSRMTGLDVEVEDDGGGR